jgi:cellulose synthase/poly-beta-1,6-N-acetylglucosamine synthase-like glycosyltransferase
MKYSNISIIIPTYNEENNIYPMVTRINKIMKTAGIVYEIIYVDDHSLDSTREKIEQLQNKYPISLHLKKGKKGKAYSLIEGFNYARYNIIGMIDADLQYPPEAMIKMLKLITSHKADIVIGERNNLNTPIIRKAAHWVFKYLFIQLLHNLNFDVQSGLKVFRKEILSRISLDPSPWTFDLDFLIQSLNAGYKIDQITIPLLKRHSGSSKISTLRASWEIGLAAVKSKFKPVHFAPIQPLVGVKGGRVSYISGFHYKGKKYVHFTNLNPYESAFFSLTSKQKLYMFLIITLIAAALFFNWYLTLIVIMTLLTILYFTDLIYYMFLISKSFFKEPEITVRDIEIAALKDKYLPTYTILCPLYKEWEVLPQFVSSISKIDYPKNKLQVMLLLEEDDKETIRQAKNMRLPNYFEIVVVPNSQPKTKPKACNYGLLKAKGQYSVIYDAEDVPDPLQLKKVVIAFNKTGNNIGCIQAKLNFYNPNQNFLTRLFTSEYSLWFELVLTGLQSVNAPIPLGGTSNHFRTKDLINMNGWDAFNVTEDCDLGMRMAKHGLKTAIVDSTTQEEANSEFKNWFNQRTRWIKGYLQTYLVHMRTVNQFLINDKRDFGEFQLVVGGKVLLMLINPIMWIISITYFAFRSTAGGFIESLFPPAIFYMGVFSMVVGNFMYLYYYMIGTAKRKQYDLVKYAYLVPVYWLMMSAAAWVSVYRLVREPHYWSKTKHGLHLQNSQAPIIKTILEGTPIGDTIAVNPIHTDL